MKHLSKREGMIALITLFLGLGIIIFLWSKFPTKQITTDIQLDSLLEESRPSPRPTSTPAPLPLPPAKYIIPGRTHVFQTFNNCGPASLSMALSYFDVTVSQKELGDQLRPYQNSRGDNDDKSVTLMELAHEAERRGLLAYYRPNATPEIIKAAIAQDVPVIVRTLLNEGEDIGHYRVLRGYDDVNKQYIQDDSLQGANLRYSYEVMERLWQPFNYEYLVVVPAEKKEIIEQILGDNLDEKMAWTKARERIESDLQKNSNDIYALFNLSVTDYKLGNYADSIRVFETVENRLPGRMLWYQIEPILAYFKTGDYERVLEKTQKILDGQNRAFSELYDLRGQVFLAQGDKSAADREFELAKIYNQNYQLGGFE